MIIGVIDAALLLDVFLVGSCRPYPTMELCGCQDQPGSGDGSHVYRGFLMNLNFEEKKTDLDSEGGEDGFAKSK